MGTVKRLAEEVARGLRQIHPKLSKPVVSNLSLAVGAMIEGQTPNTVELANLLPLETERQDMREQWLRRLLKNPRLECEAVMEPVARQELQEATRHGQRVLLSMDQTDLGDRMAVLMVCLRVGDRSLPLAWTAEKGAANIGFEGQRIVLERVRAWLPAGAAVLLLADRFYPSAALFEWLHSHGWYYRLRLKGNLLADPGYGDETCPFYLFDRIEIVDFIRGLMKHSEYGFSTPRFALNRSLVVQNTAPSGAGESGAAPAAGNASPVGQAASGIVV